MGVDQELVKVTRSICKPYPFIEGHYQFQGMQLDDLPIRNFMDIFNFAAAAVEKVVVEKAAESRRREPLSVAVNQNHPMHFLPRHRTT